MNLIFVHNASQECAVIAREDLTKEILDVPNTLVVRSVFKKCNKQDVHFTKPFELDAKFAKDFNQDKFYNAITKFVSMI